MTNPVFSHCTVAPLRQEGEIGLSPLLRRSTKCCFAVLLGRENHSISSHASIHASTGKLLKNHLDSVAVLYSSKHENLVQNESRELLLKKPNSNSNNSNSNSNNNNYHNPHPNSRSPKFREPARRFRRLNTAGSGSFATLCKYFG